MFDAQAACDFNMAVDGIVELDPVDGAFTWSNSYVRSRIDRTLVTDSWLAMWLRA